MAKTTYNKKPDPLTKSGKLFLAQQRGLTDSESARAIGVPPTRVPELEATKTYQAMKAKYADKLIDAKPMQDVIKEHIKIIEQDQDKGAKLNSIKLYIDRVEPENNPNQAQQVNIILKSPESPKSDALQSPITDDNNPS